jgi:hypothetical protein
MRHLFILLFIMMLPSIISLFIIQKELFFSADDDWETCDYGPDPQLPTSVVNNATRPPGVFVEPSPPSAATPETVSTDPLEIADKLAKTFMRDLNSHSNPDDRDNLIQQFTDLIKTLAPIEANAVTNGITKSSILQNVTDALLAGNRYNEYAYRTFATILSPVDGVLGNKLADYITMKAFFDVGTVALDSTYALTDLAYPTRGASTPDAVVFSGSVNEGIGEFAKCAEKCRNDGKCKSIYYGSFNGKGADGICYGFSEKYSKDGKKTNRTFDSTDPQYPRGLTANSGYLQGGDKVDSTVMTGLGSKGSSPTANIALINAAQTSINDFINLYNQFNTPDNTTAVDAAFDKVVEALSQMSATEDTIRTEAGLINKGVLLFQVTNYLLAGNKYNEAFYISAAGKIGKVDMTSMQRIIEYVSKKLYYDTEKQPILQVAFPSRGVATTDAVAFASNETFRGCVSKCQDDNRCHSIYFRNNSGGNDVGFCYGFAEPYLPSSTKVGRTYTTDSVNELLGVTANVSKSGNSAITNAIAKVNAAIIKKEDTPLNAAVAKIYEILASVKKN